MESSTVDLTVTSPPYGKLRTYGGHPWTEMIFQAVARELWRVTKDGGVVCWQEGDTMLGGTLTGDPYRHLLFFRRLGFRHYETIYTLTAGYRYGASHYANPPTPVWVISKGRPTTVNLLKRPNKTAGMPSGLGFRNPNGRRRKKQRRPVRPFGVRDAIWRYMVHSHTERPYSQLDHGATMHNFVARDLILSYSRHGDVVLDPMAGLATTGKWAVLLGRSFVGCEIHRPYWEWGQRRLADARMERVRMLRS